MSFAAEAPVPSRLRLNLATVRVLAGRDIVRFFRQRSRVIGALAQPVIFWLVIGSGFGRSFQLPDAGGVAAQIDYRAFFFPGVVTMVLLFSAIFATISVIEDRREGFLQGVLAGPGSRWAVVVGKSAGSSIIALLQAGLFLLLAPFAGVHVAEIQFGLLATVMVLSALALTGIGFSLAWWVNSAPGYHAVMSVVLIPMWVLSGAMFPITGAGPVVSAVMAVNPMRFAVDGVRRALFGDVAVQAATGATHGGWIELAALAAFALVATGIAAWRVTKRE
ncbi:MAG: ABC transporter permease [Myxococcaceae bacterium]